MSHRNSGRDWDRPQGVPPGNWQYINDASIAANYDRSLEQSPLVSIDQKIIHQHLPQNRSGVIVDFGCGTGRNALPLIEMGWKVLGIDLSAPMLKQFAAKLDIHHQAILVQANLAELEGVAEDACDFGQCMFSTFGMLQGRATRNTFLRHARRILKPQARLVIHAHNYWHHLRIFGGARWMMKNAVQAMRGKCELGDRFSDYRSVNQLMLHHFSLKAFRRELRTAGFGLVNTYAILPDQTYSESFSRYQIGKSVGWVIVCQVEKASPNL